jgi:hypothetical protein
LKTNHLAALVSEVKFVKLFVVKMGQFVSRLVPKLDCEEKPEVSLCKLKYNMATKQIGQSDTDTTATCPRTG